MSSNPSPTSNRRVAVFVAGGILCAGLAGLGVWQLSTPHNNSEAISTSVPLDAADSSSSTSQLSIPPATSGSASSLPAGEPTTVYSEDPFLAPHAWVSPAPAAAAPTSVYRPTNPGSPTTTETETHPTPSKGHQSPFPEVLHHLQVPSKIPGIPSGQDQQAGVGIQPPTPAPTQPAPTAPGVLPGFGSITLPRF